MLTMIFNHVEKDKNKSNYYNRYQIKIEILILIRKRYITIYHEHIDNRMLPIKVL